MKVRMEWDKDGKVVPVPDPNGNWTMGIDPFNGFVNQAKEEGMLKLPFPELLDEMVHYSANLLKEKPRYFIGIDNGVSGAIGLINADTGEYKLIRTPVKKELNYTKAKAYINRVNAVELTKILSVANPQTSVVMIERPMVNPSRFVATISAIRALEATQTVLEQIGLSYSFLDSKQWQKELLPSGLKGEELKSASLDVGKRLFPRIEGKHPDYDGILIAQFCKNKHR